MQPWPSGQQGPNRLLMMGRRCFFPVISFPVNCAVVQQASLSFRDCWRPCRTASALPRSGGVADPLKSGTCFAALPNAFRVGEHRRLTGWSLCHAHLSGVLPRSGQISAVGTAVKTGSTIDWTLSSEGVRQCVPDRPKCSKSGRFLHRGNVIDPGRGAEFPIVSEFEPTGRGSICMSADRAQPDTPTPCLRRSACTSWQGLGHGLAANTHPHAHDRGSHPALACNGVTSLSVVPPVVCSIVMRLNFSSCTGCDN